MTLTCKFCGAEFTPRNGYQKYCSTKCADKYRLEKNRAYCREHREEILRNNREREARKKREASEEAREAEKRARRLDETVLAAEAAGLSYGQYVILQRMKKQKGETTL